MRAGRSGSGDADTSCKQGCVTKSTDRFGKGGDFSFLPPVACRGKKGLSGDHDGLSQEGLGGEEVFLHTCITQALAGCTEGLKIEMSC